MYILAESSKKKDENVYRFALIALRGELLERERDSFGISYTGYLLLRKRGRERATNNK